MKKKEFENPELIIVYFTNDDIITGSGNLDGDNDWYDPDLDD